MCIEASQRVGVFYMANKIEWSLVDGHGEMLLPKMADYELIGAFFWEIKSGCQVASIM